MKKLEELLPGDPLLISYAIIDNTVIVKKVEIEKNDPVYNRCLISYKKEINTEKERVIVPYDHPYFDNYEFLNS